MGWHGLQAIEALKQVQQSNVDMLLTEELMHLFLASCRTMLNSLGVGVKTCLQLYTFSSRSASARQSHQHRGSTTKDTMRAVAQDRRNRTLSQTFGSKHAKPKLQGRLDFGLRAVACSHSVERNSSQQSTGDGRFWRRLKWQLRFLFGVVGFKGRQNSLRSARDGFPWTYQLPSQLRTTGLY